MPSLNGQWKLAADTKNIGRDDRWYASIRPDAKNAPVPGVVQQTFPETYGVYWYWRPFGPDQAITSHERYLLRFAAVDYLADVYVNSQHVGSHEGGETPFTIDITDAVRAGTSNLLAVRVLVPGDEPIDGIALHQIPHRNREHKHFCPGRGINTGGIWPCRNASVPRRLTAASASNSRVSSAPRRSAASVFTTPRENSSPRNRPSASAKTNPTDCRCPARQP